MSAIETLATTLSPFGELRRSENLARHTTFGIGGPADLFLTVRSADALARATNAAHSAGVPVFVLGSGSNILVADAGIRGLVLDNRARGEAHDDLVVRIESGASFAAFARKMCRTGLEGLTWAVGIPGTIGGAVVYNAGAYGGCLADVLRRVRLQLPGDGDQWVDAADLGMVYRGSAFTRGQVGGKAVLEAEVELSAGDAPTLLARAAAFDEKRLGAQPRGRNAGSTFKNPPDSPAWKLIDAVGMRGMRRGEAAISDKHCNFFVNEGNASAADVAWLIAEAQRRVSEQFGVALEPEVEFVGAW
ncbi:UDP-N-acetylmuramate dehydrogenase [Candidatus Amarobacter glycogenicus]|uniref:UDP-N-acetylmuramate dehydrogenase n=1 Tax=Candidatus Amarobacter glycogenicus TaxID=3140699 RepID=UPI0031369884|nr:UDP-N-acetylmuramate dehydrogenase [Dehalococcoidia bacterium]MBK8558400.1 UDP-N-acetylmuramate dehydrogenase [Dehalococcoidia bacterium]